MSEVFKPIGIPGKILKVVRTLTFPLILGGCVNPKANLPDSTDAPFVFGETEGNPLKMEETKFSCHIQVSNGKEFDWIDSYNKGESENRCEKRRIEISSKVVKDRQIYEVRTFTKMTLNNVEIILVRECALKQNGSETCLSTEKNLNGWICLSEQFQGGELKEASSVPQEFCNKNFWK